MSLSLGEEHAEDAGVGDEVEALVEGDPRTLVPPVWVEDEFDRQEPLRRGSCHAQELSYSIRSTLGRTVANDQLGFKHNLVA